MAVISTLILPCHATIYVSKTGNDSASGLSWIAARRTIGAALAIAPEGEQIWVAQGEYFERITVPRNVWIYGGFAGTETAILQRNIKLHPVVINGMASGSVVTIPPSAGSSRLDGFTLTNGYATSGGGIACAGATPVIANNTITGNFAGTGAGISINATSTVQVTGNTIVRNTSSALGGGGGIYCTGPMLVTNNVIRGNSSGSRGGGVWLSAASGLVANNVIDANSAANSGGGLSVDNCTAALSIVNNTVVANGTGVEGGGIALDRSQINLANNIIALNSSGIYRTISPGTPTLSHNCVYNPARYDYSGLAAAASDIASDPRLVSPARGEAHIQPDSPCKDAGSGVFIQPGWTDIDGQQRVIGGAVDIGADESDGVVRTFSPAVVRVAPFGTDSNSGVDWAHPKRTITAALAQIAVTGGDIWVASGEYIENLTVQQPYIHLFGGFAGSETAPSERPAGSPSPSVIDADSLATGVIFSAPGFETCTLDSFRVQNGMAVFGGGIYCLMSSPLINGCNITANTASYTGGGLFAYYSSPVIQNSVLSANYSGGAAGGIGMTFSTPAITGCRITNNGASGNGGGIVASETDPVISNCDISGNLATGSGAGVYCVSTGARIVDNIFSGNSSDGAGANGGAIAGVSFRGEITGNTVSGNGARSGGGIYLQSPASARLERNTVVSNTAGQGSGGGIYAAEGSLIIAGNLVANNTAATSGGGLYCAGGSANIVNNTLAQNAGAAALVLPASGAVANNIVALNSSGVSGNAGTTAVLRSNCVYNPGGVNYTDMAVPGTGDIQLNPIFVNPSVRDYHLAPGSPCIDTAWPQAPDIPASDLDGQARPQGSSVDIGSDEYVAVVAVSVESARMSSNGTAVNIPSAVVTAVFPEYFYIQSASRAAGLRVASMPQGLARGALVSVSGTVQTTPDQEKQVIASSVTVSGQGAAGSLVMRLETLGGADLAFSAVSGAGQSGVSGGFGLNNVGLLVRVCGRVVSAGQGVFYVSDGSSVQDISGQKGVRVLLESAALPVVGSTVVVTGISSCVLDQGEIQRVVRVQSAADIVALNP